MMLAAIGAVEVRAQGSAVTSTVTPIVAPDGSASASTGGSTTRGTSAAPPSLSGMSGGGSVELGQAVTLLVNFSGTGIGQTYQWRKNGTAIAGATNPTLVFAAVTAGDSGAYAVTVTNADGASVASTDITVKALAAPVINGQPRTTVAQVGQPIVFSFSATGSYPRSHQWRKDGVAIAAGTSATLTLPAISTADAGTYSVVVSNSEGSATSTGASLTVNAATPPIISSFSPSDVAATLGAQVTFNASLNSGSSPFTYQWLKNGAPVSGATNATFVFTAVAYGDAGRYSFTIANAAGAATSREATLTVNAPTPLTIYSTGQNQTLFQGQSLNLNVSLNGSSPITYQWQKNGTAISGATNSSFSISSVALSDAGSYTLIATNPAGSVTSNATVVTVNPPTAPRITVQPVARNVSFHDTFNLSVEATGSPPLTFAWRKDGVPVSTGSSSSGSTSSNYSAGPATPVHSGSYTVVVTNSAGSVTSNAVTITVAAAVLPVITTQPVDRQIAAGLSVSLTVNYSSSGAGSTTVQWFKDGVSVAGANSSTHSISAVRDENAGTYTAVITGAAGSVTSNAAKLFVLPPSPPVVSSWPSDQSVAVGSSMGFSFSSPQGPGPFTYQWFKDGVLLSHAISGSLSFSSVTESDFGTYLVTVANDGGIVASPPFRLMRGQTQSGTAASVPWIAVRKLGNTVYFLAGSPARIERYELAAERWLAPVYLSETLVPTAFLPLAEGIYIAYGRTLVRRSPDLTTETPITNVASNITVLFAVDDFLFYDLATTSNSSTTRSIASIRRSSLAAGPTSNVALAEAPFAPGLRRVFSADVGGSRGAPNGFTVSSDGRLTAVSSQSSFYYYYQLATGTRHFVFPAENYIANNSGTLFRASDLAFAGSIGTALDDLVFLADESPVVLREHTLHLLSNTNYVETGRVTLPFRGSSAVSADTAVFVFGSPATAGASFAVTKVPRSMFRAAALPAVTLAPGERYSVDAVFAGADGVVGIFSRSKQSVLRWSSATREYLAPLPLRGQPAFVSQTTGSTRALFSYLDGVVTEVPVRASAAAERQIGTTGNRVWALTDLGDMTLVNVRNFSDSGDHRLVFGSQGNLLAAALSGSYNRAGIAWQPAGRRLYTIDSYYSSSSNNSVSYETVSTAGVITTEQNTPTVSITSPVRLNPEATLMATGNGRVLNADLAQVGVLGNNILDATWLSGGLYTLRAGTNGEAEVQRWSRVTYLQNGTAAVRGLPQRVLAISDSKVVVVTLVQGLLSFSILNADLTAPAGAADFAGVYIGKLGASANAGDVALQVRADGTGVLLLHVASPRAELVALNVTLGPDGSFYVNARDLATGNTRFVSGSVSATGLAGSIPSLNLGFSGTKSVAGASPAGYYAAPALNGAAGSVYSIIGGDGRALLVAQSGTAVDGGAATLGASGQLALTTAGGARFTAALDSTGGLAVRAEAGSFTSTSFAGLRDDVPRTDRLGNISTRGQASTGEDAMIAGFVISGNATRPVLIRAIGPALTGFGITGAMADPKLIVFGGGSILAESDNWSAEPAANSIRSSTTRVGAFALPAPGGDAAVVLNLAPGSYTAQVSPASGGGGVALVEVYDAGDATGDGTPKLVNIATRGRVGTGEDILIAGIVVTGNAPKRILIRAIGPTLSAFGVGGALADPVLTLAAGPTALSTNDDWGTTNSGLAAVDVSAAAVSVGAFALASGSKDSCLLLTLQPGNYTAQVAGKNNSTGVALVEVYELPR